MILQDQVIICSCDFTGEKSLKVSHHSVIFFDPRRDTSRDIKVLACHLISQNHVIMWSLDFLDKKQSMSVTILPSFVAIDLW